MDTTAARRSILARIRAAQGRDTTPTAHERETVADWLVRRPHGPRMPDDLVARFVVDAQRRSMTVEQVDDIVTHGA